MQYTARFTMNCLRGLALITALWFVYVFAISACGSHSYGLAVESVNDYSRFGPTAWLTNSIANGDGFIHWNNSGWKPVGIEDQMG